MKTMTLLISPKGETTIETNGFDGHSCLEASKFLEQALGKTATEQLKSEYFATNCQSEHLEIQQ
jgi:hypothetical protein